MPKSKAFALIKEDILSILALIPEGRIASFKDIGEYLSVMPRHVAYILSTLEDEKKSVLPWYRAVGDKGKLGKPKFHPDGRSQQELLEAEDLECSKTAVKNFENAFISVTELNSGIEPGKYYSGQT